MATVEDEFSTPPQVAKLLKVSADKIRAFIKTEELVAVDVSQHRGQRPRYRISRDALHAFLARRSSSPPPKPRRRCRRSENVREYY